MNRNDIGGIMLVAVPLLVGILFISPTLAVYLYLGVMAYIFIMIFFGYNSKRFATPADPLLPMDVWMFRNIDVQLLEGSPPSERTSLEELATQTLFVLSTFGRVETPISSCRLCTLVLNFTVFRNFLGRPPRPPF